MNNSDLLNILGTVNAVIAFFLSKKAINSFDLHRETVPKNISKVLIPPELKQENNEIDLERIKKLEYGPQIIEFVEVMLKKIPQEDLICLYNNINSLIVKKTDYELYNLIFKNHRIGAYNGKNNTIFLDEKRDISWFIYHELFHLASSIIGSNVFSGFQIAYQHRMINIGKGINEGYTELLTRRYFPDKPGQNFTTVSYQYLVLLAGGVESLVGKDKMQSLYFHANLKGLIGELSKYATINEIMKFINDCDFIINHLDNKKYKKQEHRLLTKALHDTNIFLIKCYHQKLYLERFKTGEFDEMDCDVELANFIARFMPEITMTKAQFKILNKKDVGKLINEPYEEEIMEAKAI